MTSVRPYFIRLLFRFSLDQSEEVVHERVLEAFRTSPAPWTSKGEFRPLAKAGLNDVSRLDVLSRRNFPKWISDVTVDYEYRTPGALDLNGKDRVCMVIDPGRVPESQWIEDLARHLIAHLDPDAVQVCNHAAFDIIDEQIAEGKRKNQDLSGYPKLARMNESYQSSLSGEVLFFSQEVCGEFLEMLPELLVERIRSAGVDARLFADGVLIEGSHDYQSGEESLAAMDRVHAALVAAVQ